MRLLRRYLADDFAVIFCVALLVMTFVLSVGYIFKIIDIISKGVPWRPVLLILATSVPISLKMSLAMSALVGCLLLFGRLSADGEIVALQANGIRMIPVTRTILLFAMLLVALSLYVNHYVEPLCHCFRRTAVAQMAGSSGIAMLENGRFRNFGDISLYVGDRNGSEMEDIRIYDRRHPAITRTIRARHGTIEEVANSPDLVLNMTDVRIDPFSEDRPGPGVIGKFTMVLHDLRKGGYQPDQEDMVLDELLEALLVLKNAMPNLSVEDFQIKRMALLYEINKRTSLALAPLAFVLVGIPLGIRSQRKESSIGITISLGVVFLFYVLIILAESTAKQPRWHPDLIIWCPTFLFFVLGIGLLRRMK